MQKGGWVFLSALVSLFQMRTETLDIKGNNVYPPTDTTLCFYNEYEATGSKWVA